MMTNQEEVTLAQSKSVEDFLKAVYVLQQRIGVSSKQEENPDAETNSPRVATNALAEALSISAPSVTDMARRMADAALVDYRRYYGVRLTEEGEAIALHVLRRHRLIELYLAKELGYGLHEVHDEAEKLEHVVSERFVEAIAHKLGDPTVDPHGDPIPAADGTIIRAETTPLADLAMNKIAKISRLKAGNNQMLQHILERGFRLGKQIIIKERDPFEGPLTVEVDGQPIVIGHNIALCILVEVD